MNERNSMTERLQRLLPAQRWLRAYELAWLPADLMAGITLGAVLVPVGLAFGELAGLPMAGLYGGILPLLVYALVGSSRQMIVGPDSTMATMVAVALGPLALGDPLRLAGLAGLTAMMMGAICIVGGILRLGFLADFLAKPVIVGFMHGLAAVIFVGQLPKVLGLRVTAEGTPGRLVEIATHLDQLNWIALVIGVSCVAVILGCRKWLPHVPGHLVALGVSLLGVWLLGLEGAVSIVGRIAAGLPRIQAPVMAASDLRLLLPVAAAGALVAFSDTMVTARAFAARNRYPIDANQELLALGLANVAAGVSQGLPISSSGSRTAVAESAGSRSQITSVVAALTLAGALMFLTRPLHYLPHAALGGILVAAALSLCHFGEFASLWRFRRSGFVLALLTFLCVAGVGVMEGIALGVVLSIVLVMQAMAFPRTAVVGLTRDGEFRELGPHTDAAAIPGVLVFRILAPLFFANCGLFRARLEGAVLEAWQPVRVVVIDAAAMFDIDLAGSDLLKDLHEQLRGRNVRLIFANARGPLRAALERGGVVAAVGSDGFFSDLLGAVGAAVSLSAPRPEPGP
jgi:high affinity sulfate transporter 1